MAGEASFTPNKRARVFGRWEGKRFIPDDATPVVVKCANCYNYVRNIVQVIQVYKLREGHPQIAASGKDKVFRTENWCLQCVRTAAMEDDSGRTILGVGYGSA